MKHIGIFAILAVLAIVGSTSVSAQIQSGRTLQFQTPDGVLSISADEVRLLDYRFRIDSVVEEGVIRLVDDRSGATALLETGSDEGIYFAVFEGTLAMQTVAPRSSMVILADAPLGKDASVSHAAVNITSLVQEVGSTAVK